MTKYYFKDKDAKVHPVSEWTYLAAKDMVHEYADEHVVIFTRKDYVPSIRKIEKAERKSKGWF